MSSMVAGIVAGSVLLFLSHVAPQLKAGTFVADGELPRIFSYRLTRRESQLVGTLIHLALSGIFGGLYGACVAAGFFSAGTLLSLLAWSGILSLFLGLVILPIEGQGVFGIRADHWFPLDLVLTNMIWAGLLGWVLRLWTVVSS